MIVLDTETTGLIQPEISELAAQPRIVELAMIKVDDNLKEVARYESMFNPKRQMPDDASKISGIRSKDLKDKPEFVAELPRITEFFLGERILVAHNAPFDVQMIAYELKRIDRICRFPWPPEHWCTVEMTYHIKNRMMKLTELYQHVLGRQLEQKHRAMADVEALLEVLRKM